MLITQLLRGLHIQVTSIGPRIILRRLTEHELYLLQQYIIDGYQQFPLGVILHGTKLTQAPKPADTSGGIITGGIPGPFGCTSPSRSRRGSADPKGTNRPHDWLYWL